MQRKYYYPLKQWIMCRYLLGIYLATIFISLIRYDHFFELFNQQGVFTESANIFPLARSLKLVTTLDADVFLIFGTISALTFSIGIFRRVSTIFLLYTWAIIHSKSFFVPAPEAGLIGWLLMVTLLFPSEKKYEADQDYLPKDLHTLIITVFSLGMTFSGLHKLGAQSWIEGRTVEFLLESWILKENLFTLSVSQLPSWTLRGMTYFALIGEILLFPLVIYERTRLFAWLLKVTLFLSFYAFLSVDKVIGAMLVVTMIIFDYNWIIYLKNKLKRKRDDIK